MIETELVIANERGFHARAAARFVELASRFQCSVLVEREGTTVDGKSILGILTLAAPHGASIVIRTDGVDEVEALQALRELIESKFGEER